MPRGTPVWRSEKMMFIHCGGVTRIMICDEAGVAGPIPIPSSTAPPIASIGDFESVSEVARRVKNASVAGLARASDKDIDRCAEALRDAQHPRIHTFISTSPVHMKYKLQMEPERVLELIAASVSRARNRVADVEWSAEDGTRTEIDFLCRCVEIAINAGATTINIPDTVGYITPAEYEARALELATTPAQLGAIRNRIAATIGSSALYDTARHCRHLETAYTTIWQRHLRGESPQSFSV